MEAKRQEIEDAQRTVADLKEECDIMEKKHGLIVPWGKCVV